MSRMAGAAFVLLFASLAGVTGVTMIRLDVPSVVQNGTHEFVILDCVYSFNESEKLGLVVSWYFNQSMVYQWIPPRRPSALGVLQNRLDLNYSVSEDPYQSSRALKIIYPSIEMMGEYSCKVSSFVTEASKSAQMLIYAPEKDMRIRVSQSDKPGVLNVTCWVVGIFPVPTVSLLYGEDENSTMLEDIDVSFERATDGFDVWAWKTLDLANMTSESNVFECQLSIPEANYTQRRTAVYEPDSMALRDSRFANVGSSFTQTSPVFTLLLILISQLLTCVTSLWCFSNTRCFQV